MKLGFKLKHYFFNAFRELFVHHHGSLEFRAKLFTLIIASYDHAHEEYYDKIKYLAMKIYNNDEDRANLLTLLTKEFMQKIEDGLLDIDKLILNIQQELKIAPRFAKKIDVDTLKELTHLSYNKDTNDYQDRIITFLATLKEETLHTNKEQIAKDEQTLAKV